MPPDVIPALDRAYALCKLAVMTLDEYLRANDDTAEALAVRVGVTGASMSRIRHGVQNITIDLARAIERETAGKVTVAELAQSRAA